MYKSTLPIPNVVTRIVPLSGGKGRIVLGVADGEVDNNDTQTWTFPVSPLSTQEPQLSRHERRAEKAKQRKKFKK